MPKSREDRFLEMLESGDFDDVVGDYAVDSLGLIDIEDALDNLDADDIKEYVEANFMIEEVYPGFEDDYVLKDDLSVIDVVEFVRLNGIEEIYRDIDDDDLDVLIELISKDYEPSEIWDNLGVFGYYTDDEIDTILDDLKSDMIDSVNEAVKNTVESWKSC